MEQVNNNEKVVLSFRINKKTDKELDFLIKVFEEETGIKITKSQYIRYLLLDKLKEKKKEME